MTVCNKSFELSSNFSKKLTCDFEGGNITSDGGVILISKIDKKLGISNMISEAITDNRDRFRTIHPLSYLIKQKIYQMSCGYEDDNDSDKLRSDPAFKTAVGRLSETEIDLASQPTFCRLENSISKKDIERLLYALLESYIIPKSF